MTGQDSSGRTLAQGITPATPPESWRAAMADFLVPGEQPVAWLLVDLDNQLRFAQGMIVVTDRRVASRGADEDVWRAWSFHVGMTMQSFDHGGVGTLELCDGERRLACWRYTLAQDIAVHRLAEQFDHQVASALTGLLVGFLGWAIGRFAHRYLQGEPGQRRFVNAYLATLASGSSEQPL
jgi:hypothetical protein